MQWVGAASGLLDGVAGQTERLRGGATRVRTALEGSWGFTLGGGRGVADAERRGRVAPGLRHADTGAGIDVGGGLAFTETVTGPPLDVRVRTLVMH